jgi:hypothetical protein
MTNQINFNRENAITGTRFKLMTKAAMIAELHTTDKVVSITPTDCIHTYVVATCKSEDAPVVWYVVNTGNFTNMQIRQLSPEENYADEIEAA